MDTLSYQIEKTLGLGIDRSTFLVKTPTGESLVLKELALGQISDWKQLELFEREAQVLQGLSHPRIAKFRGYHRQERAEGLYLQLLTEFIPGESLQAKLDNGWRISESESRQIARQVLEILCFLQERTPPLIHRDLKPANLVLTPEQSLYLVDFGAVQEMLRPRGSTTVVGTYGYMAPEQYMGHATLSTDIYGLAATLIHLLSGIPPAALPIQNLLPDFRSRITASEAWCELLEHWLQPEPEERPVRAREALAALLNLEADLRISPSGRCLSYPEGDFRILEIRRFPTRKELLPLGIYLSLDVLFLLGIVLAQFDLLPIHASFLVLYLIFLFLSLFPFPASQTNTLIYFSQSLFVGKFKLTPTEIVTPEQKILYPKNIRKIRILHGYRSSFTQRIEGQNQQFYNQLFDSLIGFYTYAPEPYLLPDALSNQDQDWLFSEIMRYIQAVWDENPPVIENKIVSDRSFLGHWYMTHLNDQEQR